MFLKVCFWLSGLFFVYILFISFFFITLGKTKTMSYKSLYSRLKPEYLELFEKSNLKHPEIIGRILDALVQESFVTSLVYSVVLDIKFTLGIDNPFEMFKDL